MVNFWIKTRQKPCFSVFLTTFWPFSTTPFLDGLSQDPHGFNVLFRPEKEVVLGGPFSPIFTLFDPFLTPFWPTFWSLPTEHMKCMVVDYIAFYQIHQNNGFFTGVTSKNTFFSWFSAFHVFSKPVSFWNKTGIFNNSPKTTYVYNHYFTYTARYPPKKGAQKGPLFTTFWPLFTSFYHFLTSFRPIPGHLLNHHLGWTSYSYSGGYTRTYELSVIFMIFRCFSK